MLEKRSKLSNLYRRVAYKHVVVDFFVDKKSSAYNYHSEWAWVNCGRGSFIFFDHVKVHSVLKLEMSSREQPMRNFELPIK